MHLFMRYSYASSAFSCLHDLIKASLMVCMLHCTTAEAHARLLGKTETCNIMHLPISSVSCSRVQLCQRSGACTARVHFRHRSRRLGETLSPPPFTATNCLVSRDETNVSHSLPVCLYLVSCASGPVRLSLAALAGVVTRAQDPEAVENSGLQGALVAGLLLSVAVSAGFAFQGDIEDALLGDGLSGGLLPVSTGSIAAAALWSTSLWFVSPLQLLLLFLGKIETERPSDWFMNIVAGASSLPTEDLAYEHPAWVRAAAAVAVVASGCSIAVVLDTGLGDATWGVSSGIATCMAAGVYELGRPQRLSADQAVELEEQWQVFARFAERRLQQGGRCHETEIWKAWEAEHPQFRGEDNRIEDKYLRDMVANWYPYAQRTASGFYKNVSVRPKADPFTGEMSV
eukprot:jgi/Ulvmu1/8033/UM004_0270.1